MEDLLTAQVEAVGDDDFAIWQRGPPGLRQDSRLQALPGRLQDRRGNGPHAQV